METTKIDQINQAIDKHFKSNHGNFLVEGYAAPWMADCLSLSYDCFRGVICKPAYIALFVFRNFPEIDRIYYGTWIFTRSSLRRSGHKC